MSGLGTTITTSHTNMMRDDNDHDNDVLKYKYIVTTRPVYVSYVHVGSFHPPPSLFSRYYIPHAYMNTHLVVQ